ncbi:hypothetical protein Tco_0330861 [Tanacetum coccineum]
MKLKEPTYQVVLDALALTTCYPVFLITAEVPFIYMHQFWATFNKHNASYQFKINNKRFFVNVEVFREILNICLKIPGQEFDEPPSEEETISFIRELGYSREIKYITDVSVDHLHQPWRAFATTINKCLSGKPKKIQKKSDLAISSKETPSKKKPAKAKKDVPSTKKLATKPKLTKKKASVKVDRGKGLNVLSKVALSEAAQLKEATKRRKKDFHISHASGSGDGTDFESRVPDEQKCKIYGTNKGTGTKPGVPDVPKYDSESEKESWGDNGEEEDDEEDFKDKSDDDKGNNDDDDKGNDHDDDDKGNKDDGNNDDNDDDSDDKRTELDRDENSNLNQSNEEHEEEEEEYADERLHTPKNHELTDEEDNAKKENEEEEDDAKELYRDINVNLRKEDVEMTDADQGDGDQHNVSQESSSSVSSDFTDKLLNFENASLTDNTIASLMDTTVRHEEPSSQTSSIFTIPITVILEIMSTFTTTIPPPPPSSNPLSQQATPTPRPTASKYAQAISLIPAIVDLYIDNKLGEDIHKAIQSHITECKNKAQVEKREYIDLIDTSVRAIIKEEVNTQLPQAVLNFATPVIERNVIESLEANVLAKSSSQPKSTYAAAGSLSEFELTKILIDKMEEHKSYVRADYKRELYDALSRDDKDKDQDPSAGSDRGTKRRKTSKDVESSMDPKSKESKSSSSSKGASCSQHKSSGKSAHAEEPSHTVDDSGVRQNQEFDSSNNDEQPDDEAAPKVYWYKKPERPLTFDHDCNKRQHVEFRAPQTWISDVAHAKKPPTSFDELMDTPIDFSAFVMNRLNIANLTQDLLVRLALNLLKGTCKSRKQYPFDLRKPLPLIPDHRGHQVIHQDYFINNDLEYLKGGSLSRQYSTSITKTKAATYKVNGLKTWTSTKDVYSKKQIIAVTSLKIMKWYDYGHLHEIEVRREDQQLYKFEEGDFP